MNHDGCLQSGLVLEGGGMRGAFTAGVLDYFLENKLKFDSCIGVSAGACHACSFLAGQHRRAFEVSVNYLHDRRYCSLQSLLTTGDLFGAKMLYDTIPNQLYPIDNDTFLKSRTQFYAVITNCKTGHAEYHQVKDLRQDVGAVRASSSLPMLSRMVELNGARYLDGGISDSIPVRQSIQLGNAKNVVVLTQHRGYRKKENGLLPLLRFKYRKYPALLRQMENRHINYNNTLDFIEKQQEQGRVFVIQPQQPLRIGRIEKNAEKLTAVYEQGRAQAACDYAALLAYLQEKTAAKTKAVKQQPQRT